MLSSISLSGRTRKEKGIGLGDWIFIFSVKIDPEHFAMEHSNSAEAVQEDEVVERPLGGSIGSVTECCRASHMHVYQYNLTRSQSMSAPYSSTTTLGSNSKSGRICIHTDT